MLVEEPGIATILGQPERIGVSVLRAVVCFSEYDVAPLQRRRASRSRPDVPRPRSGDQARRGCESLFEPHDCALFCCCVGIAWRTLASELAVLKRVAQRLRNFLGFLIAAL